MRGEVEQARTGWNMHPLTHQSIPDWVVRQPQEW
jgi:hypothetical protein